MGNLKVKRKSKISILNSKPNNKISISKPKLKKISLEEKFTNYNGKNEAKDFSWDAPKGIEMW